MATISANAVKDLREKTGAGMMDAKKALEEAGGDFEKAVDILRKKGLSAAAKKAERVAAEGMIASSIQKSGRIGVMVDYTGGDEQLGRDIAMHIAAANPSYLSRETVPAGALERERAIYEAQAGETGKPANVISKIVDGKMEKYYGDACLLEQVFIKDPEGKLKVKNILKGAVVRRFVRYQLGEGIEKKKACFADEVAAQLK